MFSIKGPSSVIANISEVRPRRASPADVAAIASCKGLWMYRDEWATSSGGFISSISSRTAVANPMGMITAGRQPSVVFDADLGRNTASFDAVGFTSYMQADPFDYTGPFSLLAVFKAPNNPAKALQSIVGRYGASSPERAFICIRAAGTTGGIYGGSGLVYPTFTHYGDEWGYVIMGYDGVSQLTVQYNSMAPQTITTNAEPTSTTQMQLGYNASGGASFGGLLDCAAAFQGENLFASGSAANLATVRGMLATYYQDVVLP